MTSVFGEENENITSQIGANTKKKWDSTVKQQ